MNFLKKKPLHVALILLVGFMVYSCTLKVPFILDDVVSIVNNPLITKFSYFTDPSSGSSFFGHAGFASRWFGYLTLAVNYRLHGLDLPGYHLTNIAIHLLAALFVYRLALLTFRTPYFLRGAEGGAGVLQQRAPFIALLSALLFVCHPLQTQAVTYLVQRLASLMALLYLVSLTCYVSGRLAQVGPNRRPLAPWLWFAAALLAGYLAFKTKQNACTLPLSLLLYEALFFSAGAGRRVLRAVLALTSLAGVAAVAILFYANGATTPWLSRIDQAARLQTDLPRWDYLITQFRVIATYLRLVIWPVGQRLYWDYPVFHSILVPEVLLSAVLLLSMLAGALYCLFRSRSWRGAPDDAAGLLRLIAFGVFWFFLTISIESSVIPIADVIFEHRMYLPLVGLFLAAAAAISLAAWEGATDGGWPTPPVLACIAAVLLLFSVLTFARNNQWRSEVGLWMDNARKSPNLGRVYVNLGYADERAGDLVGAEAAYNMAGSLMANQPFPHLDLGRMYLKAQRLDEALAEFRTALSIDPSMGEAHNNIGSILEMKQRYDEALKEYLLAVKKTPYLAVPYCNIGHLYARQNRWDEALKEYDAALDRDPYYATAYLYKGTALLATGRKAEAVAALRRALQLNPSSSDAVEQLRLAGAAP